MDIIQKYCEKCKIKTPHTIITKDGYGASGISRIFTTLISLGMSNLVSNKSIICTNCGKEIII